MPQPQGCVVVVVQMAHTYQMAVAEGICSVLEPLGIPTVLYVWCDWIATPAPSLVRLLDHGAPRGVIAVGFGVSEPAAALADLLRAYAHVPQVHVGHTDPTLDVGSVRCDNASGMRLVAEHLVQDCGARRILVVRGWAPHLESREREAAFVERLSELGVQVPPDMVVDGEFLREFSFQAVRDALERHPDVDAVAAFNDQSALGALDALRERGLRVPTDVVVSGFDNEPVAASTEPSLTSVDQGLPGQGALAATLLLQMVDGAPAQVLRAPVQLVVRASTSRGGPSAATPASCREDALRRQADELDTGLALSRAVMRCRSVPEVIQQLQVSSGRLRMRDTYLVLGPALLENGRVLGSASDDEGRPDGPGHADPQEPEPGPPLGLVALAHQDGEFLDVAAERPFSLDRLLPEHLRRDSRSLMVFPLWTGEVELGYVACDRPPEDSPAINDVLRLDLHRCLEGIHGRARLRSYADDLERQVAERTAQLRQANEQLRLLSRLDALTGLQNRSAFEEELTARWDAHARSGRPLSLLMVDVDHFKRYNDRYGHLFGDNALRIVGQCLRQGAVRRSDVAARYGGEEFTVILSNTSERGALMVADRIRRLLAEARVEHRDSPTDRLLTLSIGAATLVPDWSGDPEQLVAAADNALYEAKHAGRNGVRAAPRSLLPTDTPG